LESDTFVGVKSHVDATIDGGDLSPTGGDLYLVAEKSLGISTAFAVVSKHWDYAMVSRVWKIVCIDQK
jgi:hypothetical protein